MPPRHAYWTILVDNQPTAFRAHDPEELVPTLNRLRAKNESAVMKWFERGKLFDSRDQAREEGYGKGERRWEGPRPDRDDTAPRRDKSWRPGGNHRDPRQKYKDAKKAKWNRFKEKIHARHETRSSRDSESYTPPHGDKLKPAIRDDWRDRERGQRPRDDRRGAGPSPADPRRGDRGDWREERRPSRPHGDTLRPKGGGREGTPRRDDRGERGFSEPKGRDRVAGTPGRERRRDDDRRGEQRPDRNDRSRQRWAERDNRGRERWGDRDDRSRATDRDSRSRGGDRGDWRDRPPRGEDRRRDFSRPPGKSSGTKPPSAPRKPWGSKPRRRRGDDD